MDDLERSGSYNTDYCGELSVFGFFMGGWIGYLLRPSTILGLQLSIQQILDFIISNIYPNCTTTGDYTSCQKGLFSDNPIASSLAYTSIEYIITGAILGAVVGWVVGKLIKR